MSCSNRQGLKGIITTFRDSNPSTSNVTAYKAVKKLKVKRNYARKKSNLIIAPNGVSGNLIYRTLVHLGGGKAYGAIYMGLNYPIIDTSRVGKISEIEGALILTLAKIK